jgi:N-acetylglutamate synthase-like GNAT family acetyltransferase
LKLSSKGASNHHIAIVSAPQAFTAWEELAQLVREAFEYMGGRIDPPSSLGAMGVTDFIQKAQDETLIVAQINNQLIGCAFAAIRDDCVYLSKVAVHQAYRRQGVTRSLFEAADELARQMGKRFLELQTRIELTENHQAFGALGFTKVAETAHPGCGRITSITMRRARR